MTTCFKCGKILPINFCLRPGEYVMCKECEKKFKMNPKSLSWVFTPSVKNQFEVELNPKPIVFCRECKYWQDNNDGYPHPECRWSHEETPDPNDYCSSGERNGDV